MGQVRSVPESRVRDGVGGVYEITTLELDYGSNSEEDTQNKTKQVAAFEKLRGVTLTTPQWMGHPHPMNNESRVLNPFSST
jgi:hypothetical protein